MSFGRFLKSGFSGGFGLAMVVATAFSADAAEFIDVKIGYSEVLRPGSAAETVIVGNDAVANATIAARNTIVVTGNAIGSTNLILLDEAGVEIFSSTVRVIPVDSRPQHAVRLITGGANEGTSVYLCGPEPGCAPGEPGSAAIATSGHPAAAATPEAIGGGGSPETEAGPVAPE